MFDYAELVKALRCCSKIDARNNGCDSCPYEYCGDDCQNLCGYAADAIEELLGENERLKAQAPSVVHCEECDLWNEWDSSGRKSLGNFVCSCALWSVEDGAVLYTKPTDFCSYGERKDSDTEPPKGVE